MVVFFFLSLYLPLYSELESQLTQREALRAIIPGRERALSVGTPYYTGHSRPSTRNISLFILTNTVSRILERST